MSIGDPIRSARSWLRRRWAGRPGRGTNHGQSGIMSVEFAFMVPILLALALGGVDFGRYGLGLSTVASAARAGVQYGVQDQVTAYESQQMTAAARQDAADPSLSVNARQYCRCPGGGGEVACGGTCPDDAFPPMYVEVIATLQLDLWFPYYPGIPDPVTLTAANTMRVR